MPMLVADKVLCVALTPCHLAVLAPCRYAQAAFMRSTSRQPRDTPARGWPEQLHEAGWVGQSNISTAIKLPPPTCMSISALSCRSTPPSIVTSVTAATVAAPLLPGSARSRVALFHPLLSPSLDDRAQAMHAISSVVRSLARSLMELEGAVGAVESPTSPSEASVSPVDASELAGAGAQGIAVGGAAGIGLRPWPIRRGSSLNAASLSFAERSASEAPAVEFTAASLPFAGDGFFASSVAPFDHTSNQHHQHHQQQLINDEAENSALFAQKQDLFRHLLLTALRLAHTCPYQDVRKGCTDLLRRIKAMGIVVPQARFKGGPSIFIHEADLPGFFDACDEENDEEGATVDSSSVFYTDGEDDDIDSEYSMGSSVATATTTASVTMQKRYTPMQHRTPTNTSPAAASNPGSARKKSLKPRHSTDRVHRSTDLYASRRNLVDSYLTNARLTHAHIVIYAYFPSFQERVRRVNDAVVRSGPLPRPWRFYIGVLIAAADACQALVGWLSVEFVACGGDASWLGSEGLRAPSVPAKLRRIARVLRKLRDAPWRLHETDDIAWLLGSTSSPGDAWTMGELVHAAALAAIFQGMTSAYLACGVTPEIDSLGGAVFAGEEPVKDISEARAAALPSSRRSTVRPEMPVIPPMPSSTASSAPAPHIDTLNESDAGSLDIVSDLPPEEEIREHTTQLMDRLRGVWRRAKGFVAERTDVNGVAVQHGEQAHAGALGPIPIQIGRYNESANDFTVSGASSSFKAASTDIKSTFGSMELGETFDTAMKNRLRDRKKSRLLAETQNPPPPVAFSSPEPPAIRNPIFEDLGRYVAVGGLDAPAADLVTDSMPLLVAEEFDPNAEPDQVVSMQDDYSWEDHGVEWTSRFLPGLGELLEDEFQDIQSITDYSITTDSTSLDTWPFRQAVWYHVLRLHGLARDDYDYTQIPYYLNARTRNFVAKVSRRPACLDSRDFQHFGFEFRVDERVHVALLAAEARKQAVLVHALYRIWRYSEQR